MTAAILTLIVLYLLALPAGALLTRLDNRLEAGMPLDPSPTLSERVQHWLGIDHIHQHLRRMEIEMAKVIDLLNGLIAQDTAASAAQATSFHNIDAAFAKLQAAVDAQGDASPEVQDAVNSLSAGFASLQKAAEDEGTLYAPADNGDQPTGGGDTPVDPGNGDDTGDTPVVNSTKR